MKIIDEVRDAKTIGISGHIRPDGDCVGSVMSLYLYLKKALPKAQVDVFLEQPADIFQCIKEIDAIQSDFHTNMQYDVFFAMDCNAERLGEAETLFEKAGKRINIDHHISNTGCGDINIIEPDRSSTCELLYGLLEKEQIDMEIAKALYIGIIHDTGVFKYSNTSPETLQTAAELIQFGFDFPKLIDETFYEKTYMQSQIMGRAILESIRFLDGRCIVSMVNKKTMHFYQAQPKDLDGIVNQLRIVKGVECAIFMYEVRPMEYKVSMRSNGAVDVAAIAVQFGGGGHVRAAGCYMSGTYHDAINNLSVHIERQLKNHDMMRMRNVSRDD
ncbi:MAG: bifunctional oligoribonuclease/PAP phosphatase NrnA [Bacillus sp. (in: Bacteria)]|nr:bifunctional oligoribonuclease/PAP phosphatase NrnA [Bacillus sp. (in: firmicutes)]MCM1426995.1 bifunctional oligoribonuclease/PAP phosphatase NrnA [Eubacterium sp.]